MKNRFIVICLLFFLSGCSLHSNSGSSASKTLMPYPHYSEVVYHFFTNYSLRNTGYGNIEFIKNSDGYWVKLTGYDSVIKKIKTINILQIWNAKNRKYISPGLPPANINENAAILKSFLDDNVENIHYDCEPYYGYPTWFKDVINDFRDFPQKNDSLLYGLSNAYLTNALRRIVSADFYININSYADTTGMTFPCDPAGSVQLFDSALYYDNLLIKKNPLFETAIGNPQNYYISDCMTAWLDLTYTGFSNYASKYLTNNRYTYDSVFMAFAENCLASCAPNAILFTHGDNDTYPLLYVQQKLHIRTDVTLININMLGGPNYIKYISKYTPIDIRPTTSSILLSGAFYNAERKDNRNIPVSIDSLLSPVERQVANNPQNRAFIPSTTFFIKTNQTALLTDPSIASWLKKLIVPEIDETINNNFIYINQIVMLDILKNNDWKRPFEFAISNDTDIFTGLDEHFVAEGMVYRLFPENNPHRDADGLTGLFNPPVNYDLLMNKYKWAGLDKNDSLTDITEEDLFENMLGGFIRAINYYLANGQNDIANTLLNKVMTVLPPQHLRYNWSYVNMVLNYYTFKEYDKAGALAKVIAYKKIKNLKRYSALNAEMKNSNKEGADRDAAFVLYVEKIVSYYGNKSLAFELDTELRKYYTPSSN